MIKYIARIIPTHTDKALINGYAFHEGKAKWYTTKSIKKSLNRVKTIIRERKDEYYHFDDYELALTAIPTLLSYWIKTYGESDFEDYKIIGVEKYIEIPIPGTKYKLTMRLDAIVEDEDGYLWLMETKTSSSSKSMTQEGLIFGDQITTYLLGMKYAYPNKPIAGAIGDIAYWHKKSQASGNVSNIDCFREDVLRTDRDFEEYQLSTAFVMNDLNSRVKAFQTGKYHPSSLFPRVTHYCRAFHKNCEYSGFCRQPIPLKGRVPYEGFRRDRNSKHLRIDGITEV
jgi:hypothetical protein